MSQSGRRQSRGEAARPPPPESTRSQSRTQTTIPSIETSDPPIQPSPSTSTPVQNNVFRVPESPRSVGGDSASKAAKVAIPRLKRNIDAVGEGSTRSGGRHRVNHACEPCRHRKTKCSGERPQCRHCQDFKITCYYADGKRDRVKKQFGSMTEKVADYEKLLKDLSTRVNDADAQLIKTALEKETSFETIDDVADNLTIASAEPIPEDDEPSGAESEASAGAGSTGALDRTDEDFTREQARETGFMGKNSEITWLQRLRQQNKFGDDTSTDSARGRDNSTATTMSAKRGPNDKGLSLPETQPGFSVQDMSYHLDDLTVTTFEAVDPYEYPTAETAQHLFNAYMTRVHPSFPIVGKVNLSAQFSKFITGQAQRPPEKWLAIVNMIFAIGAKYSHLIRADWKGDERDHLIYFTRARLLSINAETMFQHPDLQAIQLLGLISFYFLCAGQVNRSWTINGTAIRWATSLGINMRNDSTSLKDSLKEIRYRVWWALYTLEHRLCSMTGRVNCIVDDHCTTPLPAPVEEDQFESEQGEHLLNKERQRGDRAPFANSHTPSLIGSSSNSSVERSRSGTKTTGSRSPSAVSQQPGMEWAKGTPANSSLYFLHLVQLTRLTQNIFHQLYNPTAIDGVWSDIQDMIKALDEQLEHWYRNLPSTFDFRRKQRDRDYYEFRLSLGFFYFGTKMMIHRPCLCRLDRKIPGQSNKSHEFNRNAAMTCVDAAKDMLDLVPDEPNAIGLIKVGPWWSILHWLVQAASVLMLEMSFRVSHMPEQADILLDAAKKAIRWLHALGEDNLSAARAWGLCNTMLHETVAKIGRDASDMPQQPPSRASHSSSSDYTMKEYGSSTGGQMMQMGGNNQMMYPTTMSIPQAFGAYTAFDQMMHFDQYLQNEQSMADNMNYAQPTDAEMEFMNEQYHNAAQQGDGHHQQRYN